MLCPIWNKEDDEGDNDFLKNTQLGAKGITVLIMLVELEMIIYVNDGDYIHRKCRKNYVDISRIEANMTQKPSCSTRQSDSGFNFRIFKSYAHPIHPQL